VAFPVTGAHRPCRHAEKTPAVHPPRRTVTVSDVVALGRNTCLLVPSYWYGCSARAAVRRQPTRSEAEGREARGCRVEPTPRRESPTLARDGRKDDVLVRPPAIACLVKRPWNDGEPTVADGALVNLSLCFGYIRRQNIGT
jgi:hypothetical protein